MFDVGATYTREDIHAQIGGGMQACLLTLGGEVVGVCFQPKMNPRGPRIILVGRGPQKERAAAILATQPAAVPVFAKRATGKWEFLGNFKGESYENSANVIAQHVAGTRRNDVAGVLLLAAA